MKKLLALFLFLPTLALAQSAPIGAFPGFGNGASGGGSGAASINSGSTVINSGTANSPCYDNAGVIDCSDAGWSFNGTTNALTATTFIGALTGNASTATALAANPTDCGAGDFANAIAANGDLTCATPTGGVTGSGTTGLVPDWTSSTALGDSLAYRISVTNDTVTGTTVNKLAKFTSAGKAIITSAAETAGVLGIVHSGAAITGSAVVTTLGAESCVSDNATTAGHYATVSASTAGSCSDTGSATFPTAGTQVIGIWTETGVAGTRAMFFNTPDVASASSGGGGGGAKNPAGAAGDVQYRASGNSFAAEAAFNYVASTNSLSVGSASPQVIAHGASLASAEAQFDIITGTLAATNNRALRVTSTFNSGGGLPVYFVITGNGSASGNTSAFDVDYLAGYTGSASTRAAYLYNESAGTGATIGTQAAAGPTGNFGAFTQANGSTAGYNIGAVNTAQNSSVLNIGTYGWANNADAGTNIGGLFGGGRASTNNISLYATNSTSLLATSATIVGDNGAVAQSIMKLYDNGTLTFQIADGGPITTTSTFTSSATGALGWTPVSAANQACTTTCTSACVFGMDAVTASILSCTDATSDVCLCAGSS